MLKSKIFKPLLSLIPLCLVALSLLASCSSASSATTLNLTETDAGKSIDLKVGDTLQITLAGNPTTGYTWEALPLDPEILSQQDDPSFQADSNAVGSGGKLTLTFQAVTAGKARLELVYRRSWETGVAPLQTFEVEVTVR